MTVDPEHRSGIVIINELIEKGKVNNHETILHQ